MYGASAVHGIVNVLTPRVADLPDFSAGIEGGSDSFMRLRLGAAHEIGRTGASARTASARARRAGATLRASTKPSSICSRDGEVGGGTLRLRAAGTVLNQETAGFIQGYNSYRDEDIAQEQSQSRRPFAMPRARASRRNTQRDDVLRRDCRFELAGIYRRSRMDFLQHFLIGKPLEHNAQTSYMVSGTLGMDFLSQPSRRAHHGGRRDRGLRAHANSSPDRPPTARRRPMPFDRRDCTTTTPWIRTPSAPRWRSTGASRNAGRWPRRCAPIRLTTTTTTT